MVLRKAEKGDRQTLCVLCEAFVAGQREMEPALLGPKHRGADMINGAFKNPDSFILVAEEAGRIVGFAGIEETSEEPAPFFAPHPYARINFLYVAEDARGRGVGRALVEEAARWARQKGKEYHSLHTFAGNKAARALYEGAGFEDARVWMRRKL